jgi:hypoxanthine-DNA glycosylase
VLTGLPPLACSDTRLLILGSFPGVASLAAQQYYGHPRNHFWPVLSAIWPDCPGNSGVSSYEIRSSFILARGLGIWDVYAACEREGSLDTGIRNAQVNDLAGLIRRCPRLEAIAHNGGESFRHARLTSGFGLPVYRLPSTSPANASWSFDRKLAAWRRVFEQHGLV